MSCGCNSFTFIPSGGIEFDGTALVTDSIIEGGIVFGGSASVDIVQDPWDGMTAVWPLDETGSGAIGEFEDRSRNNLHGRGGDGTAAYVPSVDSTDGVWCRNSQSFDGINDFIGIPRDAIPETQGYTVTLWTKLDAMFKQRAWFSRGFNTDSGDEWVSVFGHSFINTTWASVQGSDGTQDQAFSTAQLEQDTWYHVAMTWQPEGKVTTYINGSLDGTSYYDTDATSASYTNSGYIGRYNKAGFTDGHIQEVRLHPVVRSEAWIKAERDNFCDGNFVTVSNPETPVVS